MARYTSKPKTVEANLWLGAPHTVTGLIQGCEGYFVRTAQGQSVSVQPGEYVIVETEQPYPSFVAAYPCKASIFEASYGKVETSPQSETASEVRDLTEHRAPGLNEVLTVRSIDESGPGGANHRYLITAGSPGAHSVQVEIPFQKGPILGAGPNGVSNEALLAIVIDRLEDFQTGPYRCEENSKALAHCRQALANLHERTKDRLVRGVEGTSKI